MKLETGYIASTKSSRDLIEEPTHAKFPLKSPLQVEATKAMANLTDQSLSPKLVHQDRKITDANNNTKIQSTKGVSEGFFQTLQNERQKTPLQTRHPSFEYPQKYLIAKQEFNSSNEFDIDEPSRDFYTGLISASPQLALLKTSKDPKKLYQTIENLFQAALCSSNGHFIQKLAEFISKVPNVDCATEIIDRIFENIQKNFEKNDLQCALKFGNALAAALMNIGEKESTKAQVDVVRSTEGSPVKAALKRLFAKIILSDGATKNIYQPILFPAFKNGLATLYLDHCLLVYLQRKLLTKDKNPDSMGLGEKYQITDEAFKKLKSDGYNNYHATVGTRPLDAYRKIWPQGMKAVFTGFWNALDRFPPPTANVDSQSSTRTIPIKLSNKSELNVPAWQIGALALFGSMSILREILNVWMDELKTNITEEYIFDNPELLRESLKKLLFDPNFYISSLLKFEGLEGKILSTNDQRIDYEKAYSKCWKEKLNQKLIEISKKSSSPNEQNLFENIKKLLEKYEGKNLPSREFELEFNSCVSDFKTKVKFNEINLIIRDESVVSLINALPTFKFSDDKNAQADEITLLFNAIMENYLDNLHRLPNNEFVEKVKEFLTRWGKHLQVILQKNTARNALALLIEFGLFKKKISNKLEKGFKLPVSIDELPTMLQGMQELPEKDLVDLFRGFANDSNFKKILKENLVHKLLYEVESPLVDELETFMLDEDFLSAHFGILSNLHPQQKGILESAKNFWEKFTKNIVQLIKNKDFNDNFNKLWKDKSDGGFRAQLTDIVFNPQVSQNYDLLTSFVFFKKFHKKFNKTDEALLLEKALLFIGMIYDLPTQTAAKKVMGGSDYKIAEATANDGYLKKFTREMELFGAEGKILNHLGEEVLYHEALAQIDASFVDFEKIEKKDDSRILLRPPENVLKASQTFLENEVDALVKFVNISAQGKENQEKRNLWHYVLRLAIESGGEKNLKYCLEKLEDLSPLTLGDVKKHMKFIAANSANRKIQQSCEIMIGLFSKTANGQKCAMMLRDVLSPSKSNFVIADSKKNLNNETENTTVFNTILGESLSSLKSCIRILPEGNVSNFFSWILDSKNQYSKDYLQLTSLLTTVKLETKLLNKDLLLQISSKLGVLNTYFFTEVFSDHFAMGVTDSEQENTDKYKAKLTALSKFNEIMIDTLNNKEIRDQDLEILSQNLENFSIYHQSLSPKEMQRIINAYQNQCKDSGVQHDVEYSFFPMLKLNVESGRMLLETLKESKLYSLFKNGLIERYAAVDKLLHNYKKLSLDESLELGKQTILVPPTLVYCIAALDQVKPIPKLDEVLNDNSLKIAIDTAASLIRLLNDIGTTPLLKPELSLKTLKKYMESNQSEENFLTRLKGASSDEWSRMIKDLKFGEHNVGLDSLHEIADQSEVWTKFESNVLYLSKVYQEQKGKLSEVVSAINKKIGNEAVGNFISNFVSFHEELYSMNAMTEHGEYAIAKSDQ